jgi:hypothetical protein
MDMTVYTVHAPVPRRNETVTDPDRFVFVRDGFHFWAFVFGPLWLLWHRLWLVLLLYLVATGAIQVTLWKLGISAGTRFTVGVLIALLLGLEAASLRRWTYARRRWGNLGLVVARNMESAERRFFDFWVTRRPPSPTPPLPPSIPGAWMPPAAPGVVGLFPEPQSRP